MCVDYLGRWGTRSQHTQCRRWRFVHRTQRLALEGVVWGVTSWAVVLPTIRGVVLTALYRGVVLTALYRGVVLTTMFGGARVKDCKSAPTHCQGHSEAEMTWERVKIMT